MTWQVSTKTVFDDLRSIKQIIVWWLHSLN